LEQLRDKALEAAELCKQVTSCKKVQKADSISKTTPRRSEVSQQEQSQRVKLIENHIRQDRERKNTTVTSHLGQKTTTSGRTRQQQILKNMGKHNRLN